MRVGYFLSRPFALSVDEGARTSIYLAASPEVAGASGQYFIKRKPRRPSRAARDEAMARRLWEVSETLVEAPRAGIVPVRGG
jgi:hypothetical protein